MKKSLVALAALAVIGAASAQSTVTIGGQLDAGIKSQKTSAGATTTTQAGGIHGASRMWFAGSEDMGAGNKANFRLEMQPGIDNGSTNGTTNGATTGAALFNRGAWAGLSGGWGEVRLGRQGTVAMGVICTADLLGCYGGFAGGGFLFGGDGTGTRWISGNPSRGSNGSTGLATSSNNSAGTTANIGADLTRVQHGVTYLSTNMNGFTGQIQYATNGSSNSAANGVGRSFGLNVNYAQGPLFVGAAYQMAGPDANLNVSGKQTTLSSTYDLGVVKLGGVYQAETATAGTGGTTTMAFSSAKAWGLAATFPMGAALPYVKIGQHKTNGTGAFANVNTADSQIFNIGSHYSLSKRTMLYADYAYDSKGNATTTTNVKPTIMSVGVQHSF